MSFPTEIQVSGSVWNDRQPNLDKLDRKIEKSHFICQIKFPGDDSTSMLEGIRCGRSVNESLGIERQNEVERAIAEIDRRLTQLPFDRAWAIGKAFLFMLLPILGLYMSGVWIARGFTKNLIVQREGNLGVSGSDQRNTQSRKEI
jgi:hypothetical protein